MFAGLLGLATTIKAVSSIINSDSVSEITKHLTEESTLNREQQTQLLNIQNQNLADARNREIQIEKIDKRGNWPLYSLIYVAVAVIIIVNVEGFIYPTIYAEFAKIIDASLTSATIGYLLGKNN